MLWIKNHYYYERDGNKQASMDFYDNGALHSVCYYVNNKLMKADGGPA